MLLKGVKIGFALTGSFCTLEKIMPEIEKLVQEGAEVYPIISDSVDKYDTRFGLAVDWKNKLKSITSNNIISSIVEAEPIGPKGLLDIIVVAPCTGNTAAKIANAITDTPVTMACKAHLRNLKPVVLGISTNDGLSANGRNIGMLMNMKNIYFIPYGQDNSISKPNSLVADFGLIIPSIQNALLGKQIQPVLI